MEAYMIKPETIKCINGMSYLYSNQVKDLKHIICDDLKIDKTEEKFKAVQDGIDAYFRMQNRERN